jgi:hypothetical protein
VLEINDPEAARNLMMAIAKAFPNQPFFNGLIDAIKAAGRSVLPAIEEIAQLETQARSPLVDIDQLITASVAWQVADNQIGKSFRGETIRGESNRLNLGRMETNYESSLARLVKAGVLELVDSGGQVITDDKVKRALYQFKIPLDSIFIPWLDLIVTVVPLNLKDQVLFDFARQLEYTEEHDVRIGFDQISILKQL